MTGEYVRRFDVGDEGAHILYHFASEVDAVKFMELVRPAHGPRDWSGGFDLVAKMTCHEPDGSVRTTVYATPNKQD